MIRTGLIGYGRWGKKLHKCLSSISDLQFVCTKNDDYKKDLHKIDWVVIATPNMTHYSIVKECLISGKNVFCEKPLTVSLEESLELYSLADRYGVKLYVSDIQNFRINKFPIKERNTIKRTKMSKGSTKDILFNLTYHDIYKLHEYICDSQINSIEILDKKDKLNFTVDFGGRLYEFSYDIRCENKLHEINGFNQSGDDDILPDMFDFVFDYNSDFNHNRKIALFSIKTIEKLQSQIFPSVAIVGAGIFGSTSAWYLAKKGYTVDLFDKNPNIITQASYINQYRLHRGYHYPRSNATAQSSLSGEITFLNVYGNSLVNKEVENYYCIAKKDSLVSSQQYIDFLEKNNLEYEPVSLDFIDKNSISLMIKVREKLFNPDKLRSLSYELLEKHKVNVNLNMEISRGDLDNYDVVINATYVNLNTQLPSKKQMNFQFELCEKPVVKLPDEYENKSVVIMDGPFMCIDPLGDSGYHVMGNVVHAIHSTNIGKFPIYDDKYEKLLNNGIVKNPVPTYISKFITSASKFFKNINEARHLGSMFTIRTVLPGREYDDARPTIIQKMGQKEFILFSGKIGTCVDAAKNIYDIITN